MPNIAAATYSYWMRYASHWTTTAIQFQEQTDLVMDTSEDMWHDNTEVSKLAAEVGRFCIVRDETGMIIDITTEETLPS
eukprot:10164933-Karenia_brevis.AAC.1